MTIDEVVAQADKKLSDIFETKMAELEAMLLDRGASDQELSDTLAYQRAEFEAQRGDMLAMVRRVAANGLDAADLH